MTDGDWPWEDSEGWYRTLRAARFLGVSPMEMNDVPIYWRERALLMEEAFAARSAKE